jgi:hypothetical protein
LPFLSNIKVAGKKVQITIEPGYACIGFILIEITDEKDRIFFESDIKLSTIKDIFTLDTDELVNGQILSIYSNVSPAPGKEEIKVKIKFISDEKEVSTININKGNSSETFIYHIV